MVKRALEALKGVLGAEVSFRAKEARTSRGTRHAHLDGFDLHADAWYPPAIRRG